MAESTDQVNASSAEDEEAKDDEAPSITELLAQLGRDVTVLVSCESTLAASRNLPEVRRAARDIASSLVAALAFLTAFAFANVAALNALTRVVARWFAALLLAAGWLSLGSALTFGLTVRYGHVTGWKWWRVFQEGREESLEDLERARADAEQAVHETLARLTKAMTVEIASASVSVAGETAGGVVAAGGEVLESSDEVVASITEELPSGGVVNQVWDVVLIPGRFGVKVATTVLRRGDSHH